MQIHGLSARNIGDGRSVELTWSTADPTGIRHFIVQRWDRHRRRWSPYDGFHGIVKRITTEIDDNPPQNVVVEVDDAQPSQQTFRVQAVYDKDESEWVTTSIQLESHGVRLGDSKVWYVREGLKVSSVSRNVVEVARGFAVCRGIDRAVPQAISIALPDAAANLTYLVYMDGHGSVSMAIAPPQESLLLARIYVDSAGDISDIDDLRFLWPPSNLRLHWSARSSQSVHVAWDSFDAVNLKEWRLWRSDDGNQFTHIADIDKESSAFADTIPRGFEGAIYYKISAIDWGDNVSTSSPAESIDISQLGKPLPPSNLRARIIGTIRNPWVVLEWDHSPSDGIASYLVYTFSNGDWVYAGREEYPGKSYLDASVFRGHVITYAVVAVNEAGHRSDLSDSLTFTVGPVSKPKPPEWPSIGAIETGETTDGAPWVRLRWFHVTERVSGDPLGRVSAEIPYGLAGYRIWLYDEVEDEYSPVATLSADETEYTISGLFYKGKKYTYAITSVDGWDLESNYSSHRSIVVGDTRIPEPPELTKSKSVHDRGQDFVELEWNSPTHYRDIGMLDADTEDPDHNLFPAPSGFIKEYIVYRSRHPEQLLNPVEIGRVEAEGPLVSFVDSGVTSRSYYTYAVRAVSESGNVSDLSGLKSVQTGLVSGPPAPLWDEVRTEVNEDLVVSNILSWKWPDNEAPSHLQAIVVYEGYSYRQIATITIEDEENQRTFTHSGLENANSYQYFLRAMDMAGNLSEYSSPYTITAGSSEAPHAPNIQLAPLFVDGEAQIVISWDAITKNKEDEELSFPVQSYRIYRSTTGLRYDLLDEVDGSVLHYTDRDLVNFKRYYYKVTAVNVLGVEGESGEKNALAGDTTPPLAPSASVVHAFSRENPAQVSTKITPLANASDSDVESFNLYRSEDALNKIFYSSIPAGGLHFEIQIPYGKTTHLWISAVDRAGNEGAAYYMPVEPLVADPVPVDESDISLSFVSDGQRLRPALAWSYDPEDLAWVRHFEVYWRENEQDILIGSVPFDSPFLFMEGSLAGGSEVTYGLRVRSVFESTSDITYISATPLKSSVPKTPQSVAASGEILAIRVQWEGPDENEDGSPLIDLHGYEIQGSTDDFASEPEFKDFSLSNHIYHNTQSGLLWKYRVRAVDVFKNKSDWSYSNEAEAFGVELDIDLEDFPPSQPQWKIESNEVQWESGVDRSHADEMQSPWVRLHWVASQEPHVAGYYIEQSLDGTEWARSSQAGPEAESAKISGLISGESYYFRILAFSKLGSVSTPSAVVQVAVAQDTLAPEAPASGFVIEGKGMLGVSWEKVSDPRLSHYELQYQITNISDENDPERWPDENSWTGLPLSGKSTLFIHSELRQDHGLSEEDIYSTYYRYRVRSITLSGVASDSWLIINPHGNMPRKTGEQDMAFSSVTGGILRFGSVFGAHIVSNEIEGDHIKSDTLESRHLKVHSVLAEHLNVRPGSRNWVKNSAFGLKHIDSADLGIDWEMQDASIVDSSGLSSIPVGEFALHLSAEGSASQDLDLDVGGKEMILSAYIRSQQAAGVIEVLDEENVLLSIEVPENSEWTRLVSDSAQIPDNVEPRIVCRCDDGDIWITAIKLESGDVATDWLPYSGEAYQAAGDVQINSSGIRITNGRLLIETDDGRVSLTSHGLFARNTGQSFAKLTGDGIEVLDGRFSLKTANDSIVIDEEGVSAYRLGKQSVKIGVDGRLIVHDGSMEFKTSGSGSRVQLDAQGLKAFDEANYNTFHLNTEGNLKLRGGKFEILTANDASDAGISITSTGILAKDATGPTFNLSSSGSLHIAKDFIIGPSGNPHSYLRITDGLIRGQQGPEQYFELRSDGTAEFSGSITISTSSNDPARQIVFNSEGIFAGGEGEEAVFRLTQGRSGLPAGLYLNNAQIVNGNVFIGSKGIVINGEDGLVIKSGDGPLAEEILHASSEGLKLRGGAGIQIEHGGLISFVKDGSIDPQVAIDIEGIHADAIQTGTLTVKGSGSDDLPRIEVIDESADESERLKVAIDKEGIHVYGGALNVTGKHGATIRDGEVIASALRIGAIGGANILRNGRGDFETSSWQTTNASLQRAELITQQSPALPAGVSGKYAFRFQGQAMGGKMEQIVDGHEFIGIHSLYAEIYVASGALKVKVQNASEATEEVVSESGWTSIQLSFTHDKTAGPVRIVFEDVQSPWSPTIAYITDVCLTPGRFGPRWQPHPSELAAADHRVLINDEGIKVTDGRIHVATGQNQSIFIDADGIRGKNFNLSSDGLTLDYSAEQMLVINEQGITAGSQLQHARLYSGGLKITGGAIHILGSDSQGGEMEITGSSITMRSDGGSQKSVEITPGGLTVHRGKFKLVSEDTGKLDGGTIPSSHVYIGEYGIRLGPSEANPVLSLGRSINGDWAGLHLKKGAEILIESDYTPEESGESHAGRFSTSITGKFIEVRREARPGSPARYARLEAGGLTISSNNAKSDAIAFVRSGDEVLAPDPGSPGVREATVVFEQPNPFENPPHVIISPSFFESVRSPVQSPQFVEAVVTKVTKDSFTVRTGILTFQGVRGGGSSQGSRQMQGVGNIDYIYTFNDPVNRAEVPISLLTAAGHRTTATVYYQAVGATNWTLFNTYEYTRYGTLGGGQSYRAVIDFPATPTPTAYRIRVRHNASYSSGFWGTCRTTVGSIAGYDVSYDPRPSSSPMRFRWLAIEDI